MAIFQSEEWPGFRSRRSSIETALSNAKKAWLQLIPKLKLLENDHREQLHLVSIANSVHSLQALHGIEMSESSVLNILYRLQSVKHPHEEDLEFNAIPISTVFKDASFTYQSELTREKLFSWHAGLFPAGYSSMQKINVAQWRTENLCEKPYSLSAKSRESLAEWEIPSAFNVKYEMERFFGWLNKDTKINMFLKAATAHLWFLILSPFSAGNSVLAHAITNHQLMGSSGGNAWAIPLQEAILEDSDNYFSVLSETMKGDMDISPWLEWFFNTITKAITRGNHVIDNAIATHKKLDNLDTSLLSDRQKKVIDFMASSGLTEIANSEYAEIAGCSSDTALRDLKHLIELKFFSTGNAGGRSTTYRISTFTPK